jgi:uncharacterized protein (DUF305 family)
MKHAHMKYIHMKHVALAGLLLVAACSAIPTPPAADPIHVPANAGFNEADVMFLQMMVPHVEQGLDIVRLAKDRADRHEVKTLAAAIESTESAEEWAMSERLRDWRQPATAPPNSHSEHGGQPNITARELAALHGLSGPDFERRFLNTLIAHQDDAIQLARLETSTGANPATIALAEQVDRSRSAQIQQMKSYLGE